MLAAKDITLQKVTSLSEAAAAELGCVMVDTRINNQGRRTTVEVTICRPGGHIGLNDCEQMSRKLNDALDAEGEELFRGAYLLEVQSPGLNRALKTEREFDLFAGSNVTVKSRQNVGKLGQVFSGILLAHKEGSITIGKAKAIVGGNNGKAHKKPSKKAPAEEPVEEVTLSAKDLLEIRLSAEDKAKK